MPLPPDFTFSQNNLQAYVDCPRRFELLFIRRQRWPAVQAEPVQEHERHIELGSRFHQLVFQHRQGLPVEVLSSGLSDPDLQRWWQNYLRFAPADLPARPEPEYSLSMPLAGLRLMARFDLLAVDESRAVIVDWKTTLKKSSPLALSARVQTRLYPFILANSPLAAGLSPERISMLYWFPNFPQDPIQFHYDGAKLEADRRYFEELMAAILATPDGGFAQTTDARACAFCTYRSLCERGAAGTVEDMDAESETGESIFAGIDPDKIVEIAF